MKTDYWVPAVIKIGAVLTAAPRWVGALLAAEGFILPVDWLPWWVPVSAALSACMAVVEGAAFAYVFESWRNQQDKDSDRLLWLAVLSALIFVAVLAPYIAAQVAHKALAEIITGWVLYAWAVAVGASTISIVASVGYAQKQRKPKPATITKTDATITETDIATNLRERVLMLHDAQPDATHAQLALQAGCSRQLVGRYISQNGRPHVPHV